MIAAGSETTARVLRRGIYHLHANPETLERLKQEVIAVMPDRDRIPPLEELKELPYLSAAVREVHRISALNTSRLPLQTPSELTYKEWKIPPMTPISLTISKTLLSPLPFPILVASGRSGGSKPPKRVKV